MTTQGQGAPEHSPEQYPVLPTRSVVLLPGVVAPVEVGRLSSITAVDAAQREGGFLVLVPQVDPEVDTPETAELHRVGVVAEIAQVAKHKPRRYTVTVRTTRRVRVVELTATQPYLLAHVAPMPDDSAASPEEVADLMAAVALNLAAILRARSDDPDKAAADVRAIDDPEELVDVAAGHLELSRDEEIALLVESDPAERLRRVLPGLMRLHEVLRIKADIDAELEDDVGRSARERVLRERMRAIKEELGEADAEDDLDEQRERIASSKMPAEAREAALRQLGRMQHMSPSSPEYNVAQTYLETLLELPWGVYTEDTLDIPAARAILDAGHAGLDKVKKRILEFIAVRKLAPENKGPILCLIGPPGVGKTSLGRAIASALGKAYVRAALGWVRDEAEIRGHRRTYIGALPGRIAASLRKAGSMNPVFVLDEIDKLAGGVRGDPAAALLEVLDPDHNSAFSDHYLEVDLDLSRVLFLATANQLETIPPPLLDRMEVIRLPGYTLREKRTIAREHLLPKQIAEHGLERDQLELTEDALEQVMTAYTREAGVRNLERSLAALCRQAAVKVASGSAERFVITADRLGELLGPPVFVSEVADREPAVGVCAGLAWTPTGGELLFVEARAMPGRGELSLTGQLGGVMNESASTAFSWVRANAPRLGIDSERLAAQDIHLHVPAGGVKKDGPSAGVAIAVALVSMLTRRAVAADVAVTGEITLRGKALPVGGIKEKVLAAHRAGIGTVILPERNRKDLREIPAEVRDELDIRFVDRAEEALEIAFAQAASESRTHPGALASPPLDGGRPALDTRPRPGN